MGTHMVEVQCSCGKPKYFMDTGNDEEARLHFIDNVLGTKKPGAKPSTVPLGAREKFKDILRKKSQGTDINDFFPKKFVPRQIQIDLWKEIQSCLDSGYKKIVLSAPTGVGKSLLAAAVANQMGSSFIVTSTKSLQDQYVTDVPEFYPVKGASNFACFKIMDQKKIPLDSTGEAVQKNLTCNYGNCVETVFEDGKEKRQVCSFKPKIEDLEENNSGGNDCLYYTQKYLGLVSAHSVWNYAAYFQIMDQRETFEEYLGRGVAVFDEAHKIEDQIIQFVGITILRSWTDECNISVNPDTLDDIEKIVGILEGLANSYSANIKLLKESNSNFEKLGILEEKHDRIKTGLAAISANKDNFVINKPQLDRNGEFRSVAISPLYVSPYVDRYFENDTQLFMSATIEKNSFCENLGFDAESVAFVDAPKSPFLLENRRVVFENIARLNYQSSHEDKTRAYDKIDSIMTGHLDHRGLVLTSSKSKCFDILQNLSPANKQRVTIWHSTDSAKKSIEEVLDEHQSSKNGVLLSSSLWEGVDLKDDLSRFQIIEKTPYPDLSDKRVAIKMRTTPMWYQTQTMMKLLQGFGRSVRNDSDWAVTYVIDSAAEDLLSRLHDRVPKAYHDVLGWR